MYNANDMTDLCGALISDGTESTMLKMESWVPPGTREEDVGDLFRATKSPDMHANYAVYLCSKTCHLIAQRTKYIELGEENGCDGDNFSTRWHWLWADLQRWFAERPQELLPIHTVDTKPFPHLLFGHWAAISSTQLCHTSCLLLLNTMPRNANIEKGPSSSILWHARRICGISATNGHEGCLNNAIQPLWLAGRCLSHRTEHAALVKLIKSIEAATGWGVCWRISDLEEAWGYKLTDVS